MWHFMARRTATRFPQTGVTANESARPAYLVLVFRCANDRDGFRVQYRAQRFAQHVFHYLSPQEISTQRRYPTCMARRSTLLGAEDARENSDKSFFPSVNCHDNYPRQFAKISSSFPS